MDGAKVTRPAGTSSAGPAGLTAPEAARRHPPGGNQLPVEKPPSPVRLLVQQMVHFFALLLWAAAALAVVGGLPELGVAIVVVILLNGVFAFVQEYRADGAAQALRDLVPHRVTVVRDGLRQQIDAVDLVVDDLVLLEAGDRIAADLRLLDVHGLRLDEATLTGRASRSPRQPVMSPSRAASWSRVRRRRPSRRSVGTPASPPSPP
jgi:magnesium-transporting ATPase (P-type)